MAGLYIVDLPLGDVIGGDLVNYAPTESALVRRMFGQFTRLTVIVDTEHRLAFETPSVSELDATAELSSTNSEGVSSH